MKQLTFRSHDSIRYPKDIERIQMACKKYGCWISSEDAQLAWEAYSDELSASWLCLNYSDEEIFEKIQRHTA